VNTRTDSSSASDTPPVAEPVPGTNDGLLALIGDIFESMPVALVVADAGRRIILANRETESLLGYHREDLLGRQVEMLVPETARGAHAMQHMAYLASPVARQMGVNRDLLAQRADGRLVPVEIALKPIRTAHGLMVIAAIVDISARNALESQAREANAELEQRVRERTAELERSNRDKQDMLDCLERARLELDRLSRQDSLTGLANRREFEARAQLEQRRSERNDSPMCLAMLDLDHFKQVNDCFGHALGDEVLRRIGAILRNQCRAIDVVSRHGGEEFALALADTDLAEAIATGERIRHAVETYPWRDLHPELRVTISVGVARRMRGEEAVQALARADRLLYDAKRLGRNRVESEPAP
jgi:diguanylate cyclase (GGDEF)-like protein/PAS domain S-box-containing protein